MEDPVIFLLLVGQVLGFVTVLEVLDLSLEVFFLFGAGDSGIEEVDFFDGAWSLAGLSQISYNLL